MFDSRHATPLAAVAILLLAVIFFLPVLAGGPQTVVGSTVGDALPMFYPFRAFVNGELQAGRLPLWNPHIFSGHPFHGEGQGAIFYPVNLLLVPLSAASALNLFALIHFAAMGLFFFLYLRTLGLSPLTACLGGVILCLSSAPIARLFAGHFTNLPTLALVPAMLSLWERWRRDGGMAWLGGAVLAYGSLILAGHPQFLLYASLYLLWHILFAVGLDISRRVPRRALLALGAAVAVLIVGVMIGCVQLLPSQAFAGRSFRQEATFEFVSTFSFPPENLLTLLAPHFFGHLDTGYWGRGYLWEMWIYLGVFPLALAVMAMLRVRSWIVISHGAAVAVFLLLALGKHTPLLHFLYDHVPLFDLFRGSAKFSLFALFSLCTLAAVGAERLLHPPDEAAGKSDRTALIAALGIMLLIGLGLLARFASDAVWQRLFQWRLDQGETEPGMVSQLPTAADAWPVARDALLRLVLIAGVSLSAVIAWRRLATRRHVTAVAVAALIVPEMWLFSFGQMETASTAPVTLPPEWIDEIRRESPHARVLSDVVTPNAFMTAGLDTPLGYVGNLPARMNHLLTALSGFPPDRSMAGADANPRLAERITQSAVAFRIAREGNSLALTPVRNPRPRAHFSAYQEIVPNETAALLALRSAAIDIRSIDIVESESTSALRDIAAPRAEDRVTFTEALPRHVTLETEAAGPRLLVLMDTFDPDWRCTLDGAPAEILPVNVAFRGVVVPAGRHTVEFTHTPGGFRTGALLSCVGLALALGLFVIPLVARVLLRDRDRPA